MEQEELTALKRHLGYHFSKCSPVLFTGSGFSLGCTNANSEPLPTGKQLAKELWEVCYKGRPFDESVTLSLIYQRAWAVNKKQVEHIMMSRFSVKPESIKPFHKIILSCPWSKIYTLNVDNLCEALQSRAGKLPRQIHSFSALSEKSISMALAKPQDNLALIHLNGSINDDLSRITFSHTQYAQRLSTEDTWYAELAKDLIISPVVFIGTQLDEPSLWSYIENRQKRGIEGNNELRPKSYIVLPAMNPPLRDMLRHYNIHWLNMSCEEFANDVIAKVEEECKTGLEGLRRSEGDRGVVLDRYDLQSIITAQRDIKSDLFLGAEPSWNDIVNNKTIEREFDTDLYKNCTSQGNTKKRKLVVITSTAGAGKTASLKRLALRLHSEGKRTLWFDKCIATELRTINQAINESKAEVVFVDDADIYGASLNNVFETVLDSAYASLIVVALRSSRIDRCIQPNRISRFDYTELTVPNLTDADIEGILRALRLAKRLGVLLSLTHQDRV